jgi:hypothetical protein
VVLGRAGAGKTILAIRFTIDYINLRAGKDPVPVIFSLASWDPTSTSLRDWLTTRLIEEYPGLTASEKSPSSLAADLIRANKILPILDGFDEIAVELQPAAIQALNLTKTPLLMTSRVNEYATACKQTTVLRAAVAVELADLKFRDLRNYLPRTTMHKISTGRRSVSIWAPFLQALNASPPTPAAANLAQVLVTPLMIALARSIYSENPHRNPAELLDIQSFPSSASIEKHLFASFIPAVYQQLPFDALTNDKHTLYKSWNADKVDKWLRWLAQHLDAMKTQDIAWWRLGDSLPRRRRVFMGGTETGIAALPVFGLAFGLDIGLVFGCLGGLLVAAALLSSSGPKPSHFRPRISGSARRFVQGIVGGGSNGTFLGGIVIGLMVGLVGWIIAGISGGLSSGIGIMLLSGFYVAFNSPIDIASAVTPGRLLKDDRNYATIQAAAVAVLALLGYVIVVDHAKWLGVTALARGIIFALGTGFGSQLGSTAWGRWHILVRFWLPLTGQLPWRIMRFLDDAHMRGVLRQDGPVYQFRHAGIQHYLLGSSGWRQADP